VWKALDQPTELSPNKMQIQKEETLTARAWAANSRVYAHEQNRFSDKKSAMDMI